LESVINEIYKKGDQEVQRIKEEAEKEAEKIIAEAKGEADEILRRAKDEAEKEAERLRRQEISSVKLEMKRQMLNKQKEILEAVFEALKQRIQDMDLETKRKITTALLKNNANAGMVVYSNKKDEDMVKSIIQELQIDVKYGGNLECLGGVVLESEDGEVRLNLTFDELLNQLYEQKMSEVAKILFG
jgi:V/A-type H+-transporting ATPase subunit E